MSPRPLQHGQVPALCRVVLCAEQAQRSFQNSLRRGSSTAPTITSATHAALAAGSGPRVRVTFLRGRGSSPVAGTTFAPAAAQLRQAEPQAGTARATASRNSGGSPSARGRAGGAPPGARGGPGPAPPPPAPCPRPPPPRPARRHDARAPPPSGASRPRPAWDLARCRRGRHPSGGGARGGTTVDIHLI